MVAFCSSTTARAATVTPDHKGSADITCPHCGHRADYWLNAWRKVARNGGTFLSLSFKAKTEAAARPMPAQRARDADIPWK